MRRVALSSPALWFWGAALLALAVVALVALRSPTLAVGLTAGLGLLVIVSMMLGNRGGSLALMSLFLLVCLDLPGDWALRYRVAIGGGGIFISDVLIGLLIAGAVVAVLAAPKVRLTRSPVTLPLLLFTLWMAVTAVIGLAHGNDLKYVLADVRALGYYMVFFWVIVFVRTRRDVMVLLKVLGACLAAGFVIGAVGYAQGQGTATAFVEAGVSRFPAPADFFLASTMLLATWAVVWPQAKRRPWVLWLLLGLSLLGLTLSLVRGDWVASVVGMLYLFLIMRPRKRVRLVTGIAVVGGLLVIGTATVNVAVLQSVVLRTMAITNFQDKNVQYRLIENSAVARQIAAHPVEGNGLGTGYVFDFSRYGVAPFVKYFIHNSYLWFLQRMGIVGLGLFVWFICAFLFRRHGVREGDVEQDPWLGGVVIASRVMVVALLVASITSPQFNTKENVAAIALIIGLADVSVRLLSKRADKQTVGVSGSSAVVSVSGKTGAAHGFDSPVPPATIAEGCGDGLD
jgi:O-antigen ligase